MLRPPLCRSEKCMSVCRVSESTCCIIWPRNAPTNAACAPYPLEGGKSPRAGYEYGGPAALYQHDNVCELVICSGLRLSGSRRFRGSGNPPPNGEASTWRGMPRQTWRSARCRGLAYRASRCPCCPAARLPSCLAARLPRCKADRWTACLVAQVPGRPRLTL